MKKKNDLELQIIPLHDMGVSDKEVYNVPDAFSVSAKLREAKEYKYQDYTYSGTIDTVNEVVNYSITREVYTAHPENIMNDFARFVGAIWRVDSGKDVKTIIFNDIQYTWDTSGTLQGSNWKDASGKTLVSEVVSKIAPMVEYRSGSVDMFLNDKGRKVMFKFEII